MTGARPEPVALGTGQGRWLVAVTVLASGMAFVDATAVQVALPAIGRDLGASLSLAARPTPPGWAALPRLAEAATPPPGVNRESP